MAMDTGGGVTSELALGKRLQAARRHAGLTQQQLCAAANLSYSTLAKIERGAIKAPSIFTIQSIALALNTGLDELVGTERSAAPAKARALSKSGISFVYLDLNDCLVRYHRAFTDLANDAGVSSDVVESVFWRHNDAVCRGDMSIDELNTALAQRLGIMVDWNKYYLSAVEAMPGMADLVNWVSQRYGIGILTNTMPNLVDTMFERGTLPRVHYDAIIDSSIVHALKPEPEMFEIAAAQASTDPSELLLVDDNRTNLAAASKQGWHTLWFNAYQPAESIESIKAALEPAE